MSITVIASLKKRVGNIGGTIEEQINGAFDHMEYRLKQAGLTLEDVIQMDFPMV